MVGRRAHLGYGAKAGNVNFFILWRLQNTHTHTPHIHLFNSERFAQGLRSATCFWPGSDVEIMG